MKLEFCILTEEYLEKVRVMRNNPKVSKYMYSDHLITEEEHLQWFNRIKNDPSKKQWIIKVDGKVSGYISLYDIDLTHKRCFWAYYSLSKKLLFHHIEMNVLNHVFEDLKLNKLCSEVLAFNSIVVKMHEKYGSKIEGRIRQHIYKNGKFHDVILMGILKEEWSEIRDQFNYIQVKME